MPRKLPPHVERFRDRHGKLRFYFRIGKGPRYPLPEDPRDEAFHLAWKACFDGGGLPKRKIIDRDLAGSIGALITSYRRSPEFVRLKASTKAGYNSRLERLRVDFGNRSVELLDRKAIKTRVLQPYATRPGAAHDTLKKLRILIRHAIDIGWLDHDPSIGIKRAKLGEIRSWTEDEIEQFELAWPVGSKQRTAFMLHLFTGQRVSDVHRATWPDVQGNKIRVVQQKTGKKLDLTLHSELRAALAQAQRSHVSILTTEYGRPFSPKGYGQWLRAAITKAGLPLECQPHGLRKAAGRRLAEAGCSSHEIMAVLGHKTLSEAERYTRDADQAQLSSAAVTKLEDVKRTGIPKPTYPGLGKISEEQRKTKR